MQAIWSTLVIVYFDLYHSNTLVGLYCWHNEKTLQKQIFFVYTSKRWGW